MSSRRRILLGSAALLAMPALASSRRVLAAMTDGPFYPPRAWRQGWADQDADLAHVQRDGRTLVAQGEHLALDLRVADSAGRIVDGAELEIWQCDALTVYRHPNAALEPGAFDEGFQGFGATRSDGTGAARFISIRPVPYPGRTPHIHIKLRHASFGELTSQLFVAGDAGNAGDFLWRSLAAADRAALALQLRPAPAASGLRWTAQQVLTVPA